MSDELMIGIDVGTSGVRAGVVDTQGKILKTVATEWGTDYPAPGRAQQDPQDWWKGVCEVTSAVMSDFDPDAICGVSIDTTSATVVPCTKDGKALRPAIMWMDVRAIKEAQDLSNTGDPALKYAGHDIVSAEWGTPKLMWLKRNEPEIWEKTEVIADCLDYLIFQMSGQWTASVCNCSCKFFYDSNWGGWPTTLYEAAGIPEALDKFPERILKMGEVAGSLTAEAAALLGLKAGIPVIEGGIDAHVGAIGLGVVEPGSLALITGSSHVMLGQTDKAVYSMGIWGAYYDAIIPGQYTLEAGQVSTGSMLSWFVRKYCVKALENERLTGEDPYVYLDKLASEVPIGANGIVALDHFQGNRTPFVDARSRGLFAGLSLSHTEADMYRAVLESVCYGTGAIFDTFRQKGFAPKRVMASGAPTKSKLWMQMHADVTGVPIIIPENVQGPLFGSAILAACGAGVFSSVEEAAAQMVRVDKTYEPDQAAHEEYRFYLERYLELYEAVSPIVAKIGKHQQQ